MYCRSCSLCINEGTTLDIFLHQIGIKLPRWQLECNYGHFLCCVHCLRFHVHDKYCSVLQVPEVNIKNSVSFENLSSIWSTNDSGGCCCNVQLDTVEVRLTSIRPYKVAIRHHIFNLNPFLVLHKNLFKIEGRFFRFLFSSRYQSLLNRSWLL